MSDVAATSQLLEAVFPQARAARVDYLTWLYRESPFGPVIEANLDDDAGRAGHYAIVPAPLSVDGAPRRAALSLNTAVHERARGGGAFVRLATQAYERASAAGIEIVFGVANASSTPGFVRRLAFELVAPLPAAVLVPVAGRAAGVSSGWASDASFAAAALGDDALDELLDAPRRGIARAWTAEQLRWRIRSPGTRYALHRAPGVLMVTGSEMRRGFGVAVIAKVLAARPLGPALARALVRAACRTHRAPLAIHLGLNDRIAFRGLALPRRLRPSPLNFIYRDLTGAARGAPLTRFEALDFDAY